MSLGGTWRQPHCRSGPRSVPLGARPATRQKTRHGSKMFAMALHVDHIYVFLFSTGCAINLEKKMLPAMTSGAIYEARRPVGSARQPHPAGSQGGPKSRILGHPKGCPVSRPPAENGPFSGQKNILAGVGGAQVPNNGPKWSQTTPNVVPGPIEGLWRKFKN